MLPGKSLQPWELSKSKKQREAPEVVFHRAAILVKAYNHYSLRIRSVLFSLALSNLHQESSWLLLIWGMGMVRELF